MSQHSKVDVSVVIPVYNAETYLRECIGSIISQQDVVVEIVAVDDGSTDRSLEILKQYKSEGLIDITVISTEQNRGAGYARNIALKETSGEYTIFVDSDDFVKEGAFSKLLSVARANNLDVVLYTYEIWRDTTGDVSGMFKKDRDKWNNILKKSVQKVIGDDKKGDLLTLINYPWNKFYKSEFIKFNELIFSETMVNNDIYFHWHSLILSEHTMMIDEAYYVHRLFESREQITNCFDERRFDLFAALSDVDCFLHSRDDYIKSYYHFFLLFKIDLLRWAKGRMQDELLVKFNEMATDSMKHFSRHDFMLGAHKMPNVYSEMVKLKLNINPTFS